MPRPWTCCTGYPTSWPNREGRGEHLWSSSGRGVGVASGQHLPIQLIILSQVFFLAQNRREEKRETSKEREAKRQSTVKRRRKTQLEKRDRRQSLPACLPSQGSETREISLGNAAWTSPCANAEGSGLGVGRPVTLRLVLCDPGPVPSPFQSSTVPARK